MYEEAVDYEFKKRGKPRTKARLTDMLDEDSEADKHIIFQLKKVLSLQGLKPVLFEDGTKYYIPEHDVRAVLKHHDLLQKPFHKEAFTLSLRKDVLSFMAAVRQIKQP